MAAITDKQLRDKLMKEKNPKKKKTIKMIEQKTKRHMRSKTEKIQYSRHQSQSEKTREIEESIQEVETFSARPKIRSTNENFCDARNLNRAHKCLAMDKLCNNCGKKGASQEHAHKRKTIAGKYERDRRRQQQLEKNPANQSNIQN